MHDQCHTEARVGGGLGVLSKSKEILCVVLATYLGHLEYVSQYAIFINYNIYVLC